MDINISQNLIPRIYINGRKNLINRCINNLIDNALKYANKVAITLNKKNFVIFDMRNIYSPSKMKDLKIKYFGVGR